MRSRNCRSSALRTSIDLILRTTSRGGFVGKPARRDEAHAESSMLPMRNEIAAFLMAFLLAAGAAIGQDRAEGPAALVQRFYDSYPHELEGGLPRGDDLAWISRF